MAKTKLNWKEEAWERFLKLKWDNRKKDTQVISYNKEDLEPILEKYTKSGQGEIRIFHYEHEKIDAVKNRNIMKVPISRSEWALVERPDNLEFREPKKEVLFQRVNDLTDGMKKAVLACSDISSNPGETTLLAIAKHSGIISDFYNLSEDGVMFTGGRQNAVGCKIIVNNESLDLSKAQIEIDGGFEWAKYVVIVEMKSSFNQKDFDVNQTLLPYLKWKGLLDKKIYSMVLLCEVNKGKIVYYAYDLISETSKSPFGMKINKSKKYTIEI